MMDSKAKENQAANSKSENLRDSNPEENNLLFTDEYKRALEKASYEIVGNHSAVEICGWTKKGMKEDSGGCYKQKTHFRRSA